MIALRVGVPFACWRKGHARELLETDPIPPPSTCYGMLLSLVGETDRTRHQRARVTVGAFVRGRISTVLRTTWRIKDASTPQGNGENAKPDFQQLVVGSDLLILCDGSDEIHGGPRLESRLEAALRDPSSVSRFGGLSLGESAHLVNDITRIPGPELPQRAMTFLVAPEGALTLPIWVDHVGSAGTSYAVGDLHPIDRLPDPQRLPLIAPRA